MLFGRNPALDRVFRETLPVSVPARVAPLEPATLIDTRIGERREPPPVADGRPLIEITPPGGSGSPPPAPIKAPVGTPKSHDEGRSDVSKQLERGRDLSSSIRSVVESAQGARGLEPPLLEDPSFRRDAESIATDAANHTAISNGSVER
jgi:hypothetical protein